MKVYIKGHGHVPKMAAMAISNKNLKIYKFVTNDRCIRIGLLRCNFIILCTCIYVYVLAYILIQPCTCIETACTT